MKLSHSAVEKYNQCSEMYNLHYNLKLRETGVNSNLIWGGAIDEGLNELLRTKLEKDPELLPTPMVAFNKKWIETTINGKMEVLAFCTEIQYSRKDLAIELFEDWEYQQIKAEYPDEDPTFMAIELDYKVRAIDWKQWNYHYAKLMDIDTKERFQFLCWLSLAKKAEMIFKAYELEFLPQIRRVLEIQKEISLINDDGDTVTGFIDFIVELNDGKIYIADNKTTTDFKYYKPRNDEKNQPGCIRTSNQLSVYGFSENIPNALYVAVLKIIEADGRKKGSLPTVKIRVIKDTLCETHTNDTLQKFNITNTKIKNKEFKKLEKPEMCFFFGKPCPYYNFCHKGGDMSGLIKKE